jgi:hypothetical protein
MFTGIVFEHRRGSDNRTHEHRLFSTKTAIFCEF